MDRETAELLNVLLHRVEKIQGNIVKETEIYDKRQKRNIEALSIARLEILQIVEKISGGDDE